jgi:hypothetical protein
MRIAYPAHLIYLYLIILITFGEGYNLGSSTLWNFIQPHIISHLYQEGSRLAILLKLVYSSICL